MSFSEDGKEEVRSFVFREEFRMTFQLSVSDVVTEGDGGKLLFRRLLITVFGKRILCITEQCLCV